MEIDRLLADRRQSLLARWQQDMFDIYPADSARFYSTERNAFANPVGRTTAEASATLLDLILDGSAPAAVAAALEPIVRIRAIQECAPSAALGFIPALKAALREEIPDLLSEPARSTTMVALDARVDEALLVAVDLYVRCREEVARIRVREATRQVSGLLRRFGVTESE